MLAIGQPSYAEIIGFVSFLGFVCVLTLILVHYSLSQQRLAALSKREAPAPRPEPTFGALSHPTKSGAEAAVAHKDVDPRIPTPLPAAPQPRFVGARLHAFIVWLLFVVLVFSAPMAWILFGQAGMPLVRLATIGVLLVALYAMVALAVMIITSKPSAANGSPPSGAMAGYDPSAHVDLVARITQRFCPRCRASLAADAPEGLCPACLMAGGLASAAAFDPASGLAATTPPSGSQPPTAGDWANLAQHFPQLEILELLGRGGMGAVYKARQKNLDRFVALKVIPPDAAKDPTFAERFAREARALARLNHPNIVTVYDFGQVGDVYYLLMEYVDGVNLRHAQQASRLQPQEALAIVPQICDALQYAHDHGVVHRDIKPENILLDRWGRVKIADFGLAKLLGKGPDDFTLTRTQQVMGTPRYMAPEQIEKPTTVDHRADIYSLGVVLYEMLTGELPIGRFQPPSHKVQIDVRIDEVVLRALEKEPERRYQRASQVKSELASAAPPAWHTPAPASKQPMTDLPVQQPFNELLAMAVCPAALRRWRQRYQQPLNELLAVAIGMVLGALSIAGGLAAGVYGLAEFSMLSGKWWGWMGAAFGGVIGGFGSMAGSYNTYRQMAGAEDLMKSPRTTWFDWTLRCYLAFGLVLLACGLAALLEGQRGIWQPLLTFAVIVVIQAGLFLVYRLLLRPAAGSYGMRAPAPDEKKPPQDSGGVSLPLVLAVALGIVLGVLLIAGGLAVGIYMLRAAPPS
jgi:predicted Ser/Thr protein kinase